MAHDEIFYVVEYQTAILEELGSVIISSYDTGLGLIFHVSV